MRAKMLSLQGELASREAEIALLKRSLLDAEADAAAPRPSPTAQAASSTVLKAIRKANMQLVRTDDDAFMLVPYKVATAQAAESVQEDAARLDFLIEQRAYVVSDPDTCPGHWLHWARPDGSTWVQVDEHPTPRAAIDAARKQGARWQSAGRALTLHI